MRTNAIMWWILAAYFVVVDGAYVAWSLGDSGGAYIEPAGTVGLALAAAASTLIAFYLTRVDRSHTGLLPEDRQDADIDDGNPEMGQFSPWSWWPITLGFALALLFLGLAVGFWLSFIGAAIMLIALPGWTYEYYRRRFAR